MLCGIEFEIKCLLDGFHTEEGVPWDFPPPAIYGMFYIQIRVIMQSFPPGMNYASKYDRNLTHLSDSTFDNWSVTELHVHMYVHTHIYMH